jgi:flagellar basal-body rod protein FlgG
MKALAIAATGMNAQSTNVDVIANNIANINTTGFKRSRAEFTDLLYETQRLAGVANRGNQGVVPEGAQVGLGVKTAAIRTLNLQGTLTSTGNQLDLALQGAGYFQIANTNGGVNYTRAGSFNTNATGQLVTIDGSIVDPPIIIPTNATQVNVSASGLVTATVANSVTPLTLGQLQIATFANPAGLLALGSNLFQETAASGAPVTGIPGDTEFATISQGYLEASNVDPVSEITNLISAQRAYEMNSKVITAADQMSQTLSKNMG